MKNEKIEQLSIDSLLHCSIMVTVENPDGHTYEQEVELKRGQSAQDAMKEFQNKTLGNPYGWYTDTDGKKKCYLKKNAYLAVNWRWK